MREGVERWSGQGVRGCKAGESWCWREAERQRQQEMGWTGEALQEGEIGHERER